MFNDMSCSPFSVHPLEKVHQSLGGKGPSQVWGCPEIYTLLHLAGASPKTRPQQSGFPKQPKKDLQRK